MPCETHSQPATDFEFEKHCQPFVGADKKTLSVAMRISNEDSSLVAIAPASPVPRTGRVI
jgi:predicted DNA binding CopG/RHH family protein